MVWKGDQLWGTIEVLPTPSGLLLWELYSRVGQAPDRGAVRTARVPYTCSALPPMP